VRVVKYLSRVGGVETSLGYVAVVGGHGRAVPAVVL